MAENEWLCDAKQALDLRLVRSDDDDSHSNSFKPEFVYPIFGDDETIYGYHGLDIKLWFSSGSLLQYLSITHTSKLPSQPGVQADDVQGILYKFIPPDYIQSEETFRQRVREDEDSFKPLGDYIGAFRPRPSPAAAATFNGTSSAKSKGKGKASAAKASANQWQLIGSTEQAGDDEDQVYVAYRTTWDTPGFKDSHRRMQIFVLLYIEGGTYIDEDDPRWEFVTLYERRRKSSGTGTGHTYHFVGYSSWYSFLCWPDKIRLRLSQFIVLPPYQRTGVGSAFFATVYRSVLSRAEVAELSIEDPSENCQDLRDKHDVTLLLSSGLASELKLPLDKDWVDSKRAEWKLGQRQFARLLEMILLLKEDTFSPSDARAFRLGVKERLYRFNYEMLSQLERDERVDRLQQAFEGVVQDYRRLTRGKVVP